MLSLIVKVSFGLTIIGAIWGTMYYYCYPAITHYASYLP